MVIEPKPKELLIVARNLCWYDGGARNCDYACEKCFHSRLRKFKEIGKRAINTWENLREKRSKYES